MFRATHQVRRIADHVMSHMPIPGVLLSAVLAAFCGGLGPVQLPLAPTAAVGQQPAADASSGDGPAAVELTLAARQQQVAERFQRLEQLLIRLAEVEAAENPERAALLRRAAKQSRESFILDRLSAASEALSGAQYQEAIDAQQAANENLASLLKLLLTEDRSERIREEKERIANWIKDLKREERKQRATRARAENGAELEAITEEQENILENAAELQREMAEDNEPANGSQSPSQQEQPTPASPSPSEDPKSESSDGEKSESGEPKASSDDEAGQSPEKMDGEAAVEKAQQELREAEKRLAEAKQKAEAAENDSEASEEARAEAAEALKKAQQERDAKQNALEKAKQQQAESESAAGESPSSQDGEQSPSSPSEQSQQGESPQGESPQGESPQGESPQGESPQGESPQGQSQQQQQQQQPQTPQQQAEQKLQQAIEKMKQAQQELEQAKREEATERQREAEKNLREAIDELEKILRQLREEEMQRELARLESRLRKMAQMQSEVLDQTRELAAVPASDRNRQTDLQAGKLAAQEREIVLEADRAMLLLREEGSSVAFPEVVQQIRGDMRTVADRLAQTEIDGITQGIQEDILAALEEMIAALQKAQRDLEKQQQQQQQTPQQQMGQPGEQPLVESLAELKLIRTMQQRIKQTTDRYAEMIEQSQQTPDSEFLDLLQNLADRQNRLSTITRDIVMQRNR